MRGTGGGGCGHRSAFSDQGAGDRRAGGRAPQDPMCCFTLIQISDAIGVPTQSDLSLKGEEGGARSPRPDCVGTRDDNRVVCQDCDDNRVVCRGSR